MFRFFAHNGEVHDAPGTDLTHYLQEWYIALPILALGLVGAATIVYLASRKSKPVTFLAVIGLLLVVGVWAYSYSPVTSIVALSLGMALILFSVLGSLSAPPKK